MDRLADDVRRLSLRAEDLTSVREGLDELLRRRVGYDIAALSTTDPSTLLLTSCLLSGDITFDPARERRLFDVEFAGDVASYAGLGQAVVPVARLHAITNGKLQLARRYEPVLEPLGVRDELRAVLRSNGAAWGTLTLYRTGEARPFSPDDETRIATAAAAMGDLFRLAMLRLAVRTPHALEDPPGMLLLDSQGELEALTPAAQVWLDAIDDRGRLPSAVSTVAAAARSGGGLARAALPTRDGRWVVLHGSSVKTEGDGPDDRVSIIIEAPRPPELAAIIADAHGLTSRERQITSLVSLGLANKQIAARLQLSVFTVQDHLKAVFAKTGVGSRGELVAAIYGQHYEPRHAAGLPPGPYGWFLDDEVPRDPPWHEQTTEHVVPVGNPASAAEQASDAPAEDREPTLLESKNAPARRLRPAAPRDRPRKSVRGAAT